MSSLLSDPFLNPMGNPGSGSPGSPSTSDIFAKSNKLGGGAGGSGGGGGGSRAGQRARDEAKQRQKEKEWEEAKQGLGEHAPEPVPEIEEVKPKAITQKVGWVLATTRFNTDAEVFAEFLIPESEKHRVQVEFELLRIDKGKPTLVAKAKGSADSKGRATAKLPIQKPKAALNRTGDSGVQGEKSQSLKAIYQIKAKHCAGDWTDGKGTDREVTEEGKPYFECSQVSGIHFDKDKSFIAPPYLSVFRELEARFRAWRKEHASAKIVVYGHAEKDETQARALSLRRAQIAYAFLVGDYATWNQIANIEHWGTREHQAILKTMGFYAGAIDGIEGEKTKLAKRQFIEHVNWTQGKNLNPLLGFSEDYIRQDLYRLYLNGETRKTEIRPHLFRSVAGQAYMGCGAQNRYHGEGAANENNRRAVFLLLAESENFPVRFPCKSSSASACESECQKPGKRAIPGFGCQFYDDWVRETGSNVIAPEPYEDKGPLIEVALFFDGTNNDRHRDRPKGCDTNVSKLYDLFDHDNKTRFKLYFEGVGTGSVKNSDPISGGFSGRGVQNRIDRATKALHDLIARFPTSEFKVSIFGFSRGAAISMAFMNHLFSLQNIPVLEAVKSGAQAKSFVLPFGKIWFVGLFDAVASFGLPGDDDEGRHDVSLHYSRVRHAVHFTSIHERRSLFPLSSIKAAKNAHLPTHCIEREFPGAHSDIGGGYESEAEEMAMLLSDSQQNSDRVDQRLALKVKHDKRDFLARIPCWAMYDAAKAAGITMREIKITDAESGEQVLQSILAGRGGFTHFEVQNKGSKIVSADVDNALKYLAIHPDHQSLWKSRNDLKAFDVQVSPDHPEYETHILPFIHDSLGWRDPKGIARKFGAGDSPRTIIYRGIP